MYSHINLTQNCNKKYFLLDFFPTTYLPLKMYWLPLEKNNTFRFLNHTYLSFISLLPDWGSKPQSTTLEESKLLN